MQSRLFTSPRGAYYTVVCLISGANPEWQRKHPATSLFHFLALNHFYGILVSLSALFSSDVTSDTSLVSSYSSINCESIWRLLLLNSSWASLRAQGVSFYWSTLTCQWRAMLTPFTTTSSLAKIMYWESLFGWSLLGYLSMTPLEQRNLWRPINLSLSWLSTIPSMEKKKPKWKNFNLPK